MSSGSEQQTRAAAAGVAAAHLRQMWVQGEHGQVASPGVSGGQVWASPCWLLTFWQLGAFTCPSITEAGRAELNLS